MKLEIKDKENQIKELQRDLEVKDKDYNIEVEKLKNEIKGKEFKIKSLTEDKVKEVKTAKEGGIMSRKMLDNIKKEQMIMSGVFHKIAFELYNK